MSIWVIHGVPQAGDEAETIAIRRVAIGQPELGTLSTFANKAALRAHLATVGAGATDADLTARADALWRFVHKLERNESVLVPVAGGTRYLLGSIESAYRYLADAPAGQRHTHQVFWRSPSVAVSELSPQARLVVEAGGLLVQVRPRALEDEVFAVFERLSRTGFVKDGMAPA